mgnify:FL=1
MVIRKYKNLSLVFKFLLIFLAIFSVLFSWFCVFYLRMPFPFQDMVEVLFFLDKDPLILAGDGITKFHDMEHRPVIPMIFWLLDREIFGSLGLMPLLVSNLSFLIIAVIITNLWAPEFSFKNITSWVPVLSGVALIFSLLNWHNLMWEKQLHVSLSLLFVIIISTLVTKHDKKYFLNSKESSFQLIILINILCWAAAFSFGYGVPIIFIILIHGLIARWPIKHLVICACSSLLIVLSYMYLLNLREQGAENIFVNINSLWSVVPYVAGLLGSTFSSIGLESIIKISPQSIALVSGYVMLFLYLFGAVKHYRQFIAGNPQVIRFGSSALLICSSCIGMALITWYSRPIETGGIVDRYFIVSSIFIISLPGMFISKNYWRQASSLSDFVLLALITVLITISIMGHVSNYSKLKLSWHFSSLAAIGANYKVYIPGPNEIIGPPLHQSKGMTESVWSSHKKRLTKHNKLIPFDWHGKQINNLFNNLEDQFCEGSIEKIVRVPGYKNTFIFEAWSKHFNINAFFSNWILAVNKNGKIVGLGSTRRTDFNDNLLSVKEKLLAIFEKSYSRNAGYILSEEGQLLDFYSVIGKNICKFSSAKTPKKY